MVMQAKKLKELTDEGNTTFSVTPRIGTISPWSSKATSIAWVCGFDQNIKRIERGLLLQLSA